MALSSSTASEYIKWDQHLPLLPLSAIACQVCQHTLSIGYLRARSTPSWNREKAQQRQVTVSNAQGSIEGCLAGPACTEASEQRLRAHRRPASVAGPRAPPARERRRPAALELCMHTGSASHAAPATKERCRTVRRRILNDCAPGGGGGAVHVGSRRACAGRGRCQEGWRGRADGARRGGVGGREVRAVLGCGQ